MPAVKRIVCLANSRKNTGRCIAGKELVNDEAAGWVRPVSERPSQEVSEEERQYPDGSDPRVLDLFELPLMEPRPKAFQTENWLLDPLAYWRPLGRATWTQIIAMTDRPAALWLNTSSTYSGKNDRVAQADAEALRSSLYLLHLPRLTLRVFAPGVDFGNAKRRVLAAFIFSGAAYQVWVTDPVIERDYLAKDDGTYEVGESCVTVSLGEASGGFCYKLVAAIITPERAGN